MLDGPQDIFKTLSWEGLDTFQTCCGDTTIFFLFFSLYSDGWLLSLFNWDTRNGRKKNLHDQTTCVIAGMLKIYAVGFHHPAPLPPPLQTCP